MGFNIPAANKGGDAPQVDDGLALLRFEDLVLKEHEDWATESDKFGKPDNGDRYHFEFTLLDAERKPVYEEGEPEPINVEAVTRTATGAKSNFAAILKGILSAQEYALWKADQPFDGDKVQGRVINAKIGHNKGGWPLVEATLGEAKAVKGKA